MAYSFMEGMSWWWGHAPGHMFCRQEAEKDECCSSSFVSVVVIDTVLVTILLLLLCRHQYQSNLQKEAFNWGLVYSLRG